MTSFTWTEPKERAAFLLAEGKLTHEEIAADVGVVKRTFEYWRATPEFAERVGEIVGQLRAAIAGKGIAERQTRVDALNDIFERLRTVILERATDPQLAGVPGGKSGALVAEPMLAKVYGEIGEGGRFQALGTSELVYKYAVDHGLFKEIRETLKQAAQELGQWTERRELTGKDGGPIEVKRTDLSKLSDDELKQLESILTKTAQPNRDSGGAGPT